MILYFPFGIIFATLAIFKVVGLFVITILGLILLTRLWIKAFWQRAQLFLFLKGFAATCISLSPFVAYELTVGGISCYAMDGPFPRSAVTQQSRLDILEKAQISGDISPEVAALAREYIEKLPSRFERWDD